MLGKRDAAAKIQSLDHPIVCNLMRVSFYANSEYIGKWEHASRDENC